MASDTPKKRTLYDLLVWLGPWFGLLGVLTGIAGVLFALYGGAKGEIAYNAETFTIFDATESGGELPFQIVDKSGKPITTSVHALKVNFANNGDLAAEPDLVRSDLSVS